MTNNPEIMNCQFCKNFVFDKSREKRWNEKLKQVPLKATKKITFDGSPELVGYMCDYCAEDGLYALNNKCDSIISIEDL